MALGLEWRKQRALHVGLRQVCGVQTSTQQDVRLWWGAGTGNAAPAFLECVCVNCTAMFVHRCWV